jgi:phosphoserine phosphatase
MRSTERLAPRRRASWLTMTARRSLALIAFLTCFTTVPTSCEQAVLDVLDLGEPVASPAPPPAAISADPLPSWQDGRAKRSIFDFVERVTRAGGSDFVPVEERIATFDNDGTLWAEQPRYVQAEFVIDRVRALAPQHPEWKTRPPFQGLLEGNKKAVDESDPRGVMDLLAATSANMTTDEFEGLVTEWLMTARDPRFERRHTELVYQPMLELIAYLQQNQFKTFIVSAGGADFIRPWAPARYHIPREQIVGSRLALSYEVREEQPVLVRKPKIDGAGKPVGIQQVIGQRPLAAFGNSDGDFEMLEWTSSGPGPRFVLVVHHTDGVREWAYDRDSAIGQLSRVLDVAPKRGWVVVDMKEDWKVVFPFQEP